MLILSKCNAILKSPSALSCFSKMENPSMPIFRFNAFTRTWFPEASIPMYKSKDAELQKKLDVVQNHPTY
jgi:hypothetical protein